MSGVVFSLFAPGTCIWTKYLGKAGGARNYTLVLGGDKAVIRRDVLGEYGFAIYCDLEQGGGALGEAAQ